MPSKAEQVAARVTAVLTANLVAIGAQAVYRDRNDAMTREETPVLLVELVDEDSRSIADGHDQDLLRLQVCTCVRGDTWQTVADAVRVAAHAFLVADPVLQGILASSLRRDRAEWRSADTDVPFGYCNQIYQGTYITLNQKLD
jgi:hypothetical protein